MRKPLALGMELVSVALKTAPTCDGCGRGNGGKGNKFQPISGRDGPRRYRAWKLAVQDERPRYFCTACADQMAAVAAAVAVNSRSPLRTFSTNCPDCTEYCSAETQVELAAALADHRKKTGCGKSPVSMPAIHNPQTARSVGAARGQCWDLPTWMTRAGLWATIRTFPARDNRFRAYVRIPEGLACLDLDFLRLVDGLSPDGSRAFIGTLDDPLEAGGKYAGFIAGPAWPLERVIAFAESVAAKIGAFKPESAIRNPQSAIPTMPAPVAALVVIAGEQEAHCRKMRGSAEADEWLTAVTAVQDFYNPPPNPKPRPFDADFPTAGVTRGKGGVK